MPYKIAVSSGWWSIARSPELLGLGRKVMSVATYGVNYVQADVENPAEFVEPELVNQIKWAIDGLGIKWGLHGEIGEFIAWDAAMREFWRQSHRRLHQYLDNIYEKFIKEKENQKYKPEYVNFHASNMLPIGYVIERYRVIGRGTVDFKGRDDFSKLMEEEPKLKEWFRKNVLPLIINIPALEERAKEIKRMRLEGQRPRITDEEYEKRKKEAEKITEEERLKMMEDAYKFWSKPTAEGIKGEIAREELAYAVCARYIYIKRNDPKEPVWKLFFGDKSFEDVEKQWKVKIVDPETGKVELPPTLVAAIATRYILGHFQEPISGEYLVEREKEETKKHPSKRKLKKPLDSFYYKTGFEKLDKVGVKFVFEPPESFGSPYEGLQRIVRPIHIYNMVKSLRKFSDNLEIMVDLEHLLHNGIDPEKEFPPLPKDFGKITMGCHVSAPKPIHPAHEPIDVGSEAQRIVYKYLYMLREKGFKEGVLVFERGGRAGAPPGEFIRTTISSLRLIVKELDKDTQPDKLPPEFFGIPSHPSVARQMATVSEHALDPLKGTLKVPEEEHTLLSTAAIRAGKRAEEWKKEELR